MHDESWKRIFEFNKIDKHNFDEAPYILTSVAIKAAVQDFKKTGEKEVRILCKQDTRASRPAVFVQNNLFLLPIKNGVYIITKGEGYIDIPEINKTEDVYISKLDFELDSSKIGNSEMQHLDFAYASSLIREFMGDSSLVLTIRGRKYTPTFDFKLQNHAVHVESVQTEVDAGYEGRDKIVLIEAKNTLITNVIIRQFYYPFRQWQAITRKKVVSLLFMKVHDTYALWEYEFTDSENYNSIRLVKSNKYYINRKG